MTKSKSMAMTVLGLLALTSAGETVGVVQPRDSETLTWLSDYGEALALSKQTGRPLLVEFRCAP